MSLTDTMTRTLSARQNGRSRATSLSCNRANLVAEGVVVNDIVVTGNAVTGTVQASEDKRAPFSDPQLELFAASGRHGLLVMTNQRENQGRATSS
ncbi:hypothetical protein DM793_21445 [Paenarthrobacter nitroguajacolicus]|uniref:hypothetical protein n=1 Tax=Paenarthrobacter nitroguajacolicus TaxID=211146 RepID=UPI0015BB0232|nr:hypothetical protein [Paenarthrobacter nitroguajacolicus]NWL13830.1 hypothetical protein [Paenarthrobacter nitroguajacolicus]